MGIGLLTLGKNGLHIEPLALLLLVPALSASAYTIIQKRLLTRHQALGLLTATVWCGTIYLLVFTPALLVEMRSAPPGAWGSVIYLGVFPGTISYALWSAALSRLPVSTAVSFLYLIPPLATLIAWLWLHEVPPPLALLGGTLALCGVALANKGKLRN
jgi:drug/metabolite transporter (DMT)-like permease